MRCIYCLEEKEPSQFTGREHVLLQSFGRFDQSPGSSYGKNFVLKCVCDPCNQHFGDGIDIEVRA